MNILIDASHNSNGDKGASYKNFKEEEESRTLANVLKEILIKEKHTVSFVHPNISEKMSENNSLSYRCAKANSLGGDLLVSLHFNASVSNANGTEVFVYNTSTKAYPIAKRVNDQLSKYFYKRNVKVKNFKILRDTKMPAMLIEVCFIDSDLDMNIYKSNVYNCAKAIAQGILGKDINSHENEKPSVNSGVIYKVVCGSFASKDNAITRMKEVEKLTGLECFVDTVLIK